MEISKEPKRIRTNHRIGAPFGVFFVCRNLSNGYFDEFGVMGMIFGAL